MGRRVTMVVALTLLVSAACGGSPSIPSSDSAASPTQFAQASTQTAKPTSTRAPTPTFAPTSTSTATMTPEPTATLEPTPVPIVQRGFGAATVSVDLVEGLAIVTMRHYGQKRFAVSLKATSGEEMVQLFGDQGSFQGSRAVSVKENGIHQFEIVADGEWELEIRRPTINESVIRDVPLHASGTGVQAVYFVKVEPGRYTVRATHRGERDFIVSVLTDSASDFRRIISAKGAFGGVAEITVREKPFSYLIFNIRADGDWSLEVE